MNFCPAHATCVLEQYIRGFQYTLFAVAVDGCLLDGHFSVIANVSIGDHGIMLLGTLFETPSGMIDRVAAMVHKLHYTGMLAFDFIFDRDGTSWLIDANFRTSLFATLPTTVTGRARSLLTILREALVARGQSCARLDSLSGAASECIDGERPISPRAVAKFLPELWADEYGIWPLLFCGVHVDVPWEVPGALRHPWLHFDYVSHRIWHTTEPHQRWTPLDDGVVAPDGSTTRMCPVTNGFGQGGGGLAYMLAEQDDTQKSDEVSLFEPLPLSRQDSLPPSPSPEVVSAARDSSLRTLLSRTPAFDALLPYLKPVDMGLSATFGLERHDPQTGQYWLCLYRCGGRRGFLTHLIDAATLLRAPPLVGAWLDELQDLVSQSPLAVPSVGFIVTEGGAKLYLLHVGGAVGYFPDLPVKLGGERLHAFIPDTANAHRGDLITLEWIVGQAEGHTALSHYSGGASSNLAGVLNRWAAGRLVTPMLQAFSAVVTSFPVTLQLGWQTPLYAASDATRPPFDLTDVRINIGDAIHSSCDSARASLLRILQTLMTPAEMKLVDRWADAAVATMGCSTHRLNVVQVSLSDHGHVSLSVSLNSVTAVGVNPTRSVTVNSAQASQAPVNSGNPAGDCKAPAITTSTAVADTAVQAMNRSHNGSSSFHQTRCIVCLRRAAACYATTCRTDGTVAKALCTAATLAGCRFCFPDPPCWNLEELSSSMMAEENMKLAFSDPTRWASGPRRIMANAETTGAARKLHEYFRDSAHRDKYGGLLVAGETLRGYTWYMKTQASAAFDSTAQVMNRQR